MSDLLGCNGLSRGSRAGVAWVVLLWTIVAFTAASAGAADPAAAFVRPSGSPADVPVWGVRGGLAVGLWPTGHGPRGLIRIFTPYLGQTDRKILNFIAVEPVVGGSRDLSELQLSAADHRPGKPMWTADAIDLAHPPAFSAVPAPGVVTRDGPASVLTVFVLVERFNNGAQPVVKLTFRSDRPHEFTMATFGSAGGAPMESCVLTATMGNWARLRHLHLKGQTVEAADVFRGKPLGGWGFFPGINWPASAMSVSRGEVSVSATGDIDPVPIAPDAPRAWLYQGRQAVQTWSTPLRPSLYAHVNGRSTFWGTHAAIPGGPAFENFELETPFEAGQTFRFAVEPR